MRRPALHSTSNTDRDAAEPSQTAPSNGARRLGRRDLLAALGASGAAALAGCSTRTSRTPIVETPPTAPDAPWPTAHGTPANTGRASSAGPPDDPTATHWDLFDYTDDIGDVYSAPVAGDYVYVARVPRGRVDPYRDDDSPGHLFAVDPASDDLAWDRSLPALATGPPALVDGRVVVSTTAGELVAFDAQSGTPRWSRVVGSPAAPPTTTATRVFAGDGDGRLHAFAPDGTRVWSATYGPTLEAPFLGTRPRFRTKPAVGETYCYAVVSPASDHVACTLVAYRLRDGGVAWTHEFRSGGEHHPPAVSEGTVYLPESGVLRALDASTGRERWHHVFGTYRGPSTPAVGDSHVYVAAKNAYALDRETGRERWRYVNTSTGGDRGYRHPLSESPALAGDDLYVGIGCLDAATGDARWGEFGNDPESDAQYYGPTERGTPAQSGPAVADGALYVTMRYGRLYRFGGGR
ncbi:PQQ-binding-like beta-propeller repeat protein [Halarchaeum sp. P4]|uniref:outer membrane protein assembly factor BamB family protein n=1 Tax=Halarchaeum sp. P4 TaxID=3421639 RepID=UPI003EBE0237